MSLRLDWCSHKAAKYACEQWHYSGGTPNQKLVKIGVWEDDTFIGVVLYGSGANNNLGKPYGLSQFQCCELVRIALAKHNAPVSKIASISLRLLRNQSPNLRLVVSYADPEQGHNGGIYQAMNWLYAGMTEPADEYLVNGTRMHGRALRSTRSTHRYGAIPAKNVLEWTRRVLDPDAKPIAGSRKHRYLYPLDSAMRDAVQHLAKPYPKRD